MLKYVIKSFTCQDFLIVVDPSSITFIETFFAPVRKLIFDHVKHHKEIQASADKNLLSAGISYINILMMIFFL